MRKTHNLLFLILVGIFTLSLLEPAQAAPLPQADPIALCEEGVRLFLNDQVSEAMPLLEAGFAGRDSADFTDPDDLGACALVLGILRYNNGDLDGALEAYNVALDVYRSTGNRGFERSR